VLMMPKSLLRDERSSSALEEFTEGKFQSVIDDKSEIDRKSVKRVVVCAGKVFFTLDQKRTAVESSQVAIVRVEQFYPFPAKELAAALETYPNASELVWVQEEPKNMGGWYFIESRLRELFATRFKEIRYCGRDEAASPAVGSYKWHLTEEDRFCTEAFSLKNESREKGSALVR
jgi:2-oxoglutarate dehydrogenase E1 component